MAQQRAVAAGERGRHRPRKRRLDRTDEEHAAMQPPQPALRETLTHRTTAEAEGEQLRERDDAVLAPRQLQRRAINDHNVTLGARGRGHVT